MPVSIHHATRGDIATISNLNHDVQAKHVAAMPWLFKDVPLDSATVASLLDHADTIMLLARLDGESAGYVYAQARSFPETPLTFAYKAVHVHHISVRKELRQSGIGRALVEAVKSAAADRGIERVTADIWSFNEQAVRFFQSCGLSPYLMRCWHQPSS